MNRGLIGGLLLALLLACGGQVPTPPLDTGGVLQPAVVPEPALVPQPMDPPIPTDAAPTGRAAPTPVEVEAAYLADCHHVFKPAVGEYADLETSSGVDNECEFLEFDQNCAPDMFSCWSKGQECDSNCGEPCSSCQETCAGTCDSCKTACSGDSVCLTACAKHRSECRDTCLAGLTTCFGACSSAEEQCYKDADKLVAEKCPQCDELQACLAQQWSDNPPDCQKQFASAAKECFEWCNIDG